MRTMNKGMEPTFVNRIRQEVLDLTLASPYLFSKVKNWDVSRGATLSDHMYIVYEITTLPVVRQTYRNPKQTDWELYKETLLLGIDDCSKIMESIDDIDINCDKISSLIKSADEASCPETHKNIKSEVLWWNRELDKLRSKARKLFNRAKETGQWNTYKGAVTSYKKALRNTKRDSWRKFCEGVEETPTAARLHKVLSKDHSNGIGYLIKPDGSGKETANILLEAHFPGCNILTNANNWIKEVRVKVNSSHMIGSIILANKIVLPEKVKWAIRAFKPYKAASEDGIFPAMIQKGFEVVQEHLVNMFKASFTWSYIPRQWRETTVVFLPKAGNRPTDLPKS